MANLARPATTAQFYRQDALPAPNPTHLGANLAQLRTTLQRQQELVDLAEPRRRMVYSVMLCWTLLVFSTSTVLLDEVDEVGCQYGRQYDTVVLDRL